MNHYTFVLVCALKIVGLLICNGSLDIYFYAGMNETLLNCSLVNSKCVCVCACSFITKMKRCEFNVSIPDVSGRW